jgi:hypothetical protein
MKRLIKYSAGILAGVLLASSCTKDFQQINTNPTAYSASNFDPNYILTTTQLTYSGSIDFSYDTWRANLIYSSTMIQGFSTVIGYWAGDKYLLNPDYTAAYWGFGSGSGGDGAYPEQVKPIVDLVEFTNGKAQYKNLYQIGRIMKAMIFERITDLYGDCPYSQAGMAYYQKILFPKYDKQQDIYTDIFKELQDATAKLDPAADHPAGDVYYHGDITKWQRFGNTLLLRAAMRLSKVDPNTAKTIVQSVIGKTMQSNADNAFLLNDATGGRPTVNRNAQVLLGSPERNQVKWSKTFIDLLKSTNDPRLPMIAITNPVFNNLHTAIIGGNSDPAVQKGQPNGYDLSGIPGQDISTAPGYTTIPDYSGPSMYLVKLNAPTFVLTYAESELLLADAAERFGIAGGAAQHYHDGVKAAITYLSQYDVGATISDAAAETYLTANPYDPANGLNMINTQYWALTNTMLDFYESWSTWRRTGFPVLTPVVYPGNATNGTIPRRFPYPLAEANANPANYNVAHSAVPGGDNLTGRVWWDK